MKLNVSFAAEEFSEGTDGDIDVVVDRVSENRSPFFFDANDRHGNVSDLQNLPDRIDPAEELFLNVAPDNANHRGVIHFMGCEKSTCGNGLVFDLSHAGRRAHDLSSKELALSVLQIEVRTDVGSNFGASGAVCEQPFIVVKTQGFVPLPRAIPVFLAPFPLMGKARNHEMVYSENLGHRADDVAVESADRSPNNDHRSHTNDDSN